MIGAFDAQRPRLRALAYRMLGTVADAEEVVQEAFLRWHQTDRAAIRNAEAWLVTATTRLAIDRLRAAKVARASYPGTWLPEPTLTPPPADEALARIDDMSIAFLTVLEQLAPEARAAFVLREVADVDYAEIAETLGKSEDACRQLVHRAKAQLRDARPRAAAPPAQHARLVRELAAAMLHGDVDALKSLIAEDATLVSDGGGKVSSLRRPLAGRAAIGKLYRVWITVNTGAANRLEVAGVNGELALLRFDGDALESVQTFETAGTHITRIAVQRNPDKLARVLATRYDLAHGFRAR